MLPTFNRNSKASVVSYFYRSKCPVLCVVLLRVRVVFARDCGCGVMVVVCSLCSAYSAADSSLNLLALGGLHVF